MFHVNLASALIKKFSHFLAGKLWSLSLEFLRLAIRQILLLIKLLQRPNIYSKSPTASTADTRVVKKYLSISFSHAWYPANKRFASDELRWNSARPVKRMTWKPSP